MIENKTDRTQKIKNSMIIGEAQEISTEEEQVSEDEFTFLSQFLTLTDITTLENAVQTYSIYNKKKHNLQKCDDIQNNLSQSEFDMEIDDEMYYTDEKSFLEQFDLNHLTKEEQEKYKNILINVQTLFAKSKFDIGEVPESFYEASIETI